MCYQGYGLAVQYRGVEGRKCVLSISIRTTQNRVLRIGPERLESIEQSCGRLRRRTGETGFS